MAKYIVAVSGGVDSVVLLDMFATEQLGENAELIVAHFDHGIRDESAEDAAFARNLAEKYELPFVTKREELGTNASEELARERRYAFLREVAKKYDAKIVTAHHADDVIETIAINLTRGTGWRGLAVLDNSEIWRPLLDMRKAEIIAYAKEHHLSWREDATNQDTKYLRNKLRQKLINLDADSRELLHRYRDRQLFLRQEIDTEVKALAGSAPYARHLLIMIPDETSIEILRAIVLKETGQGLPRPQLLRGLLAVKTFRGRSVYEMGGGVKLRFTRTHFTTESVDVPEA